MNNDKSLFSSFNASSAAPHSPIHPILIREREPWERYQAFSLTEHGEADIANRVMPRLWGYIMVKVVDREAHQYNTDPLSATELLDVIENALSLVERERGGVKIGNEPH